MIASQISTLIYYPIILYLWTDGRCGAVAHVVSRIGLHRVWRAPVPQNMSTPSKPHSILHSCCCFVRQALSAPGRPSSCWRHWAPRRDVHLPNVWLLFCHHYRLHRSKNLSEFFCEFLNVFYCKTDALTDIEPLVSKYLGLIACTCVEFNWTCFMYGWRWCGY